MKSKITLLAAIALLSSTLAPLAYAQKGMGEPTGVARRAVKPELTSFAGNIVAVVTEPCEKTTGRGVVGTHVLLRTKKGRQRNVHLGWSVAVEDIASRLTVGKKVGVTAFRTEKMPEGHYVAQSLEFDGNTVQLRDENLRPFWAGRGRGPRRSQRRFRGSQRGFGGGPAKGW